MLLHCPSRKCNTTRDHKLKLDTRESICMDCGETNNMITDFTKNAMKSQGDIYRSVQGRKAFMYKCPKCSIDRGVKIIDEKALCESCLMSLDLSSPMIEAIKQSGASVSTTKSSEGIEEADEAPKAELNKGSIRRRSE